MEQMRGGGVVSAERGLSVPTCAHVLTFIVCRKRACSRAREHCGGRPHRRSAQAMAGRRARAHQHLRGVQSRRLARRPMRTVILGHHAVDFRATMCGAGGTGPPPGGGG